MAATIALFTAAFLPIYKFPGDEPQSTYSWNLVGNDTAAIIPLVIIYLWPLLILGLSRVKKQRLLPVLVQYAEPFMVVFSSIIILWIPQLVFETRTLFGIMMVPIGPAPSWGCYLAVAANGLYLVSWLAGLLRPWSVQVQ